MENKYVRSLCTKFAIGLLILLCLPASGLAEDAVCFHCGMKRADYGHSWMVIEFENGRSVDVCSIHCAAIEIVLNKDELIDRIEVGDYNTHRLIDAYRAHWVIGGDRPGVMSTRAKWAFADEADAKMFIKQHGGKRAVFEEVIRAAFADLYEDTIAIKRKKKRRQMEQPE